MSYSPLKDTIFSGNPQVPTASFGDNDTTAASTGFVHTNFVSLTGTQTITGAKTFSTADVTLGAGVDLVLSDSSLLKFSDADISRAAAGVLTLGAAQQLRVQVDPSNDNDVARKSYVDSIAAGIRDWKDSVQLVEAVGNLDLTGEETIDGVLTSSSRVLVTAQTLPEENGIYVTGAGAWTRADDADTSAEVTGGMSVFVTAGGTYADTAWVLTTNDPITLGTTGLSFVQFSSATVISNLADLSDVDTSGVVDGALFRYESSGTQWNDTSTLLFSDAGQLQVTTSGASAGIVMGGGAQIYDDSGDLRTPDNLIVDTNLTVSGRAILNGGMQVEISGVKAANYPITTADHIIPVDCSGGVITITLPATPTAGDVYIVKDSTGSAASNNITVARNGSTIDGAAADDVIDSPFVSRQYVAVSSSAWLIV